MTPVDAGMTAREPLAASLVTAAFGCEAGEVIRMLGLNLDLRVTWTA